MAFMGAAGWTGRAPCTRRSRPWSKPIPLLAQVVQMRYFGGYSEQEIAETLEVTERTVQRDWEKARLILAAALR